MHCLYRCIVSPPKIVKENFISHDVNIANIGNIFSGTIPTCIGRTVYTHDKAASVSRHDGKLSCDNFQLKYEGKKYWKYSGEICIVH